MAGSYKDTHSLRQRQETVSRMLLSRPLYIPVIIEKIGKSSLRNMARKFLIPPRTPFSQILWMIRDRIRLPGSQALFVFVNETLVPTSADIGWVYSEYKDEDGFLYLKYMGENTFG